MPNRTRQTFAILCVAGLFSTQLFAQSDPGSLLEAEFAPLAPVPQPSELNEPLLMGPKTETGALPEHKPAPPQTVIESQPQFDKGAPGALVLPDLTIPTPENSGVDTDPDRTTLKPPLVQPDGGLDQAPAPRMHTPQAHYYGSSSFSHTRSRAFAVPVQVEFFTITRGFGYQPYGVYGGLYRPPVYGYRFGGYVPYGGYGYGGRNCPNRW